MDKESTLIFEPDCVSLGCKMPVAFRDVRTGFSFCVGHKRRHEEEHPDRTWSQIEYSACDKCHYSAMSARNDPKHFCSACNPTVHAGQFRCAACSRWYEMVYGDCHHCGCKCPGVECASIRADPAEDIADTIRAEYAILKAAKEQKALAQDAADKAQEELERVTKISDAALSEFRTLVSPHAGVYSLRPGHVLIIEIDLMAAITGDCRWRESEVL